MKKTIFKYISVMLGAGAMLISGCNKLDQEPTNKFTDKAFWTSPKRAEMVLNMAYNQMYSHGKIWEDEVLSDNLYESRGNPDSRVIRMGQASPNTGKFESEWKWLFEGIKTSNIFLKFVDDVPDMSAERLAQMKGQIRFIRASLFFRMANLYGDTPLFLKDISLAESRLMTRTPYSQVIAALHTELDEIIPGLPTRNQLSAGENGRITRAAAMTLKARLYMYERVSSVAQVEENMRKAAEICGKIMHEQGTYGSYSLLTQGSSEQSAYEYLFTSSAEYNSEVILDYAAVELTKQWSTLHTMIPLTITGTLCGRAPTRSLVDSYMNLDGSVPANTTVYSGRDPRLAATVVYNGYVWKDRRGTDGKYDRSGQYRDVSTINTTSGNDRPGGNGTPTGFYTRKYFDPTHGINHEMWTNIIMMRYADVLLMYAEAKAYLGEMDATVWDDTIKPIRERAGVGGTNFPGSGDYTDIVRSERRVELALEGLRYFDLMRWVNYNDTKSQSVIALLNGPVYGAKEYNNGAQIDEFKFNSSRDIIWSLPLSETQLVPSLLPNNSGY